MGIISWADQSCAGKGFGSLSRNLAAAQPEGCRAVLLISGGNQVIQPALPCSFQGLIALLVGWK
jgi:hypothetical protein